MQCLFILSSSIVGLFLLSYFPLLLAIFGQHFKIPKEAIHRRRTYFGSWPQRNESMVISLHYFYNYGKEGRNFWNEGHSEEKCLTP